MAKQVVSFHYVLTDPQGKQLDSSKGHAPFMYLEGAQQIIPGLEKAMTGLAKGSKQKIQVPAKDAYGEYDQKFVVAVPLEKFPKDVKVGDEFQSSEDPHGHPFRVVEMTESHAMLDANHPLAGVDLTFDVEVVDLRDATEEELSHGHAHGGDGHHH